MRKNALKVVTVHGIIYGKNHYFRTGLAIWRLLGMQQANNGMLQMKGYHDPQLKGAFSIQMNDEEEREASILERLLQKRILPKNKSSLRK